MLLHHPDGRLDPGTQPELLEQMLDVNLDCRFSNVQLPANQLIA